jgi:hypothetical protein
MATLKGRGSDEVREDEAIWPKSRLLSESPIEYQKLDLQCT